MQHIQNISKFGEGVGERGGVAQPGQDVLLDWAGKFVPLWFAAVAAVLPFLSHLALCAFLRELRAMFANILGGEGGGAGGAEESSLSCCVVAGVPSTVVHRGERTCTSRLRVTLAYSGIINQQRNAREPLEHTPLQATGRPKRPLVPGFPVTPQYTWMLFLNSKNTWLG